MIPLGHVDAPQQTTRDCDRHCDAISKVKGEIYNAGDQKEDMCIFHGRYPMRNVNRHRA